jgi:hypothetical protein
LLEHVVDEVELHLQRPRWRTLMPIRSAMAAAE